MKKEGYWEMRNAKPNEGHRVLAALEAAGRLKAVITQNIDGLHADAGSSRILELHGSSRHCICVKCSQRYDPDLIQERLEGGVEIPLCNSCGGFLKVGTVSFGQSLPADVLTESFELATQSDLCLAIGSSLVVEPAASIPLQTKRDGGRLVIINRDETPLDGIADIVLHEPIGETLLQVAEHMGID
jgi:NAD-dependent deacetylase